MLQRDMPQGAPTLRTRTADEIMGQYLCKEPQETSGSPALPPTMEGIGFFHDKGYNIGFDPNRCIELLQGIFLVLMLADGTLGIYNYEDGIWESLSSSLFGVLLMNLMNQALPNSWRAPYEKLVYKGLLNAAERAEPMLQQEHLIPVCNGVYDLNRNRLLPHHPNYLFRSKSPVVYDPAATCPLFLKTVEEICCGDGALVKLLQEIWGYCLLPTCKAEKAFFWLGVGANGKSLLSDLLREIIGPKNTSQIQLSSFSERFGLEAMIGKQLNIAAENEMDAALNTEAVKAIVSGDVLNITRKYHTDLEVRQTTKLIFLLNSLPDSFDQTHGFYHKIIIVPFERVFQPEEMDRERKRKLLGERSGILNWALKGAERLMLQDYCFTKSDAAERATQNYQKEQNPVAAFYQERLVYEKGQRTYRDNVLISYVHWLAEEELSGQGTDSPQKFWKLLKDAVKSCGRPELSIGKRNGKRFLRDYRIGKN